MKVKIITNKEGQTLTTKEGKALKEYKLELNDIIIPHANTIYQKLNKTEDKSIINYKIKCIAKGVSEDEPIYVTLTPAQAQSLQKKIDNGIILSEHMLQAYEYQDKDNISRIGIGFQPKTINPKTFKDFEEN